MLATKGAPWEGLIEYGCGWWVDVGVEPLAEAIQAAVAMTDTERQEMGKRGYRLVEVNFSWPRIAKEMLAMYQWILGQGSKPGSVKEMGRG